MPPVNDGAQAIVIYDTILSLTGLRPFVISIHREKAKGSIDANIIHFSSNHFAFRLVKAFLRYFIGTKFIRSSKYLSLLTGITLMKLRHSISVIIVHSTKMNWLLELRRWFPSTRIVSYHHSSEDHLCSPDIFRNVVDSVDGHFFVSDYGRIAFLNEAARIGINRKVKAWTIQNGVRLEQFKRYPNDVMGWRTLFKVDPEKVTILFAGRVIPRKGIDLLLGAIDLLDSICLTKIQLIIAGGTDYFNQETTPYRVAVAEQITRLREKIPIGELGYVSHANIHKVFAVSDIYVFPSIAPEGCPLGLIEAASMGIPVISNSIGGIDEIVENGVTGILIEEPFTSVKLSEALNKMVVDIGMRNQMGDAAYELSRRKFAASRMAHDFERALDSFAKMKS